MKLNSALSLLSNTTTSTYTKINTSMTELNNSSTQDKYSSFYKSNYISNDNNNNDFENIQQIHNTWKETRLIELDIIKKSLTESNLSKHQKANFNEKTHLYRESILSTMFNNDSNYKIIYYYFLLIFIWLFFWVISRDFCTMQKLIGYENYYDLLFDIIKTAAYLIVIYLYSFVIIVYVQYIKRYVDDNSLDDLNDSLTKSKSNSRFPYRIVITVYIWYWCFLYLLISIFMLSDNTTATCSIIIGCELARTSLKIHAYFREKMLFGFANMNKLYVEFKPKNVTEAPVVPCIDIKDFQTEFFRYLYFLFCPSLIYRDKYPRLRSVRWSQVFAQLFNFCACIVFFKILAVYCIEPFMLSYTLSKYNDK